MIFPVVLYGCGDTWSLTLREKRRLWVFENTMLRRVFGPNKDVVTGEWRRLYNEELNDLYSPNTYYSGDQIEKNEKGWARGTYGTQVRCIQGSTGET
jgi:hypothetical protein